MEPSHLGHLITGATNQDNRGNDPGCSLRGLICVFRFVPLGFLLHGLDQGNDHGTG